MVGGLGRIPPCRGQTSSGLASSTRSRGTRIDPVDAASEALVLIDLMPRIVSLPTAPLGGDAVLARCRRLTEAFRARGGTVVLVRAEHPGVAE